MSSTKKVRFALPLVMVVAVVAVMAVVAVIAVAVVMAAAVMSVLVATAAVVMVVVAVVVVPVVAVAAVVAGVVAVSYGLAQSASNKELLTAQYRPPDDHLAEEVTLANLPENSAEWPDAPGMPNAITFRSQATVRVSSSRPRHQLKVMNNDLMLAVVVAMFGAFSFLARRSRFPIAAVRLGVSRCHQHFGHYRHQRWAEVNAENSQNLQMGSVEGIRGRVSESAASREARTSRQSRAVHDSRSDRRGTKADA
jgi:hypothetical protein